MQPQENTARVLLELPGNSTKEYLLKNLYCLECGTGWPTVKIVSEKAIADLQTLLAILVNFRARETYC